MKHYDTPVKNFTKFGENTNYHLHQPVDTKGIEKRRTDPRRSLRKYTKIIAIAIVTISLNVAVKQEAVAASNEFHVYPVSHGVLSTIWKTEIVTYKNMAIANTIGHHSHDIPQLSIQSATVTDNGVKYIVSVFDNDCGTPKWVPTGPGEGVFNVEACNAKIAALINGRPRIITMMPVCLNAGIDVNTGATLETKEKSVLTIKNGRLTVSSSYCLDGDNKPLQLAKGR